MCCISILSSKRTKYRRIGMISFSPLSQISVNLEWHMNFLCENSWLRCSILWYHHFPIDSWLHLDCSWKNSFWKGSLESLLETFTGVRFLKVDFHDRSSRIESSWIDDCFIESFSLLWKGTWMNEWRSSS